MSDKCSICHSEKDTWIDDPILTLKGLAGEEYKGINFLDIKHVKEIQDKRKEQEIDLEIPEEDRTIFSEITSETQFITKQHINELRKSTEKILAENLEITEEKRTELLNNYFNYDVDENYIGTYEYGQKIEDKEEWTDINVNNKPTLPTNQTGITKIKAIHIEDLRHPIFPEHQLIINTDVPYSWDDQPAREINRQEKIIHVYKHKLNGQLKFDKYLTGNNWAEFDLGYTPSHLFYLNNSYIYYRTNWENIDPYIFYADKKFKIGAYVHQWYSSGVDDSVIDINNNYMYWLNVWNPSVIYKYKMDNPNQKIKVFEIPLNKNVMPILIMDKTHYYFIKKQEDRYIFKVNKETNLVEDTYTSTDWWYFDVVHRCRVIDMGVDKDSIYVLYKKTELVQIGTRQVCTYWFMGTCHTWKTVPIYGYNTWIYIDKINKENKNISTYLIGTFIKSTNYRRTAFAVGKNIYIGHTFLEENAHSCKIETYDKETFEKLYEDTQVGITNKMNGLISLVSSEELAISQKYKE